MKKHNIVYKTTNLINGKIYIGVHSTNKLEDGYIGSGKIFKDALKKYGLDNFFREVLFDFETAEEAYAKEKEMVSKEFINESDNYNCKVGGEQGACSELTKQKFKLRPNKWKDLKGKTGEDIPWFGKPLSEKRKEHLSEIRKGENNPMWGVKGENHHSYGERISKEERSDKKEERIKNDPEFSQRIKDIEKSSKEYGWKRNLAKKWGVHPRTALMFIRRWHNNDVNRDRKCLSCNKEIHADGEYCRPCFYKAASSNIFKDWDIEELKKLKEENSINSLSKRFKISWRGINTSFKMRGI